jgi:hypothetical protein
MTDRERVPQRTPIGTLYVYRCSGAVQEIGDIEAMTLTNTQVIFDRGDLEAVVIERRDIYFTCCQPGAAPSAY